MSSRSEHVAQAEKILADVEGQVAALVEKGEVYPAEVVMGFYAGMQTQLAAATVHTQIAEAQRPTR